MSAVPQPDYEPAILQFPKLHRPPDTRTLNPGVTRARRKHRPAPGQQAMWPTAIDPEILAYAETVEQSFRDPLVPEANRTWLRKNLGLRQFYEDWMLPERLSRVSTKQLARGTVEKDRQALNRWERYSRPEDWEPERPWPGLPLGSVTGRYVTAVLERMRGDLGDATTKSTWNHLRTMFNYAVRVRALEHAPKPERVKVEEKRVQIYRPEQIEAAYFALREHVDLQVAFVLSLNAGPRTVDLFLLRWDGVELLSTPTLQFTARKTHKPQTVPLAPITVQHLQRLPSLGQSPWLFPGLSSPEAMEPERSKPAMRRRDVVRRLFAQAGIHFPKPFQVGRATCNTRLNSTPGFYGCGLFVLGHGLSLNSKSYMEPSDLVFKGVNAVEQPPCFSNF